ncbi:hypothetical protein N9W11_07090 [Psychrosphaera haliotis]|uniref:hypothetical protein n=1 Tax=Psychrosphaera haliotis TaxID=555083 RepID=UPI002372F810|nr:hypothetical protein [Psychrosphaera haliotis]
MSEENKPVKLEVGIGVGIAVGVAIGVATDNLGLGIALGVALGAAYSMSSQPKPENGSQDVEDDRNDNGSNTPSS